MLIVVVGAGATGSELARRLSSRHEVVLIDPEAANERAVHVYQKLGFRIVETFIAPWHPVPHYLMHMRREDLKALMA